VLPRLAPGQACAANVWNAAGLLATALVGAGLVHLLAYHVPLGVPPGPRWIAAALTLLAHCPLVGPLGLIAAIAVLAPLLACWELRRLERLSTIAVRLLRARHRPLPPTHQALPRSPWRLLGLFALVLSLQMTLMGLAPWLDSMQTTMVMGGRLMAMASMPVLPLGLLHLVVAALLALLLWRVEHRLTQVRAEVARRLRMLTACGDQAAVPIGPLLTHLRSGWDGLTLFARPPPHTA
jgi:uncharacterized membrane protein